MSDTIVVVTNKVLSKRQLDILHRIASDNNARLVTCGDRRVTHHTAWFTIRDYGRPFTQQAAMTIRRQALAEGIEL